MATYAEYEMLEINTAMTLVELMANPTVSMGWGEEEAHLSTMDAGWYFGDGGPNWSKREFLLRLACITERWIDTNTDYRTFTSHLEICKAILKSPFHLSWQVGQDGDGLEAFIHAVLDDHLLESRKAHHQS